MEEKILVNFQSYDGTAFQVRVPADMTVRDMLREFAITGSVTPPHSAWDWHIARRDGGDVVQLDLDRTLAENGIADGAQLGFVVSGA